MPASSVSFPWPLSPDPFLSLEALDDPDALAWVEQQNARTRAAWCNSAEFESLRQRLADAYLPRERPVIPDRWKEWAYDLWQDERNPKGIWRRTTWAAWRGGKPEWQNLLDFDALGAAEGTPWVCVELDILYPDGDRALITLSPGGSDALVVREFDIDARRFVDDGFVIAKAGKHTASWIDRDTLYVGWDNGRKTLTRSGYPREVRRWTRGTALADAPVVFKGAFGDIGVEGHYDPVEHRHTVVSSVDFFDSQTYYLDGADGAMCVDAWRRYEVPSHVAVGGWQGWLLLEPRLDWDCNGVHFPGGALLAIREDAFLRGERDVQPLFTPTPQTSACEWTHTRNHLIVSYLEDVQNKTLLLTPSQGDDQAWHWQQRVFPTREDAQADVSPVEPTLDDEVFVDTDDYLQPPAYWLADLARDDLSEWELLDRWPTQFDATQFARHAWPRSFRGWHARAVHGDRTARRATTPASMPAQRLRRLCDSVAAELSDRAGHRLAGARRRVRGRAYSRRRRVRHALAYGGARRASPARVRRFHRGGRGAHRHGRDERRATRHSGRQQRRLAGGGVHGAAPRIVRRRGVRGALARHEPLSPAARGRVMDRRIRRSRRTR